MAYSPTLEDIEQPKQSMGYQPSLADLPQDNMINTLIGRLPNPRTSGFLQDKELMESLINQAAGIPGYQAIGKAIPVIKSGITKGIEYLQPDRKAAEFMQKIGGGATSQQNSNDFVELLRYNRHLAEKDALKYKEPVFNALGDSKILPDERFVNALGENKTTQAKGYF